MGGEFTPLSPSAPRLHRKPLHFVINDGGAVSFDGVFQHSVERVLIVEEEALLGMTLRDVLSANGFATTTARWIDEAMRLAEAERFDAAVVSWRIGDATAASLLNELGRSGAATVVLVTDGARAVKSQHPDCAVLEKPCALDDLLAELRRLSRNAQRNETPAR